MSVTVTFSLVDERLKILDAGNERYLVGTRCFPQGEQLYVRRHRLGLAVAEAKPISIRFLALVSNGGQGWTGWHRLADVTGIRFMLLPTVFNAGARIAPVLVGEDEIRICTGAEYLPVGVAEYVVVPDPDLLTLDALRGLVPDGEKDAYSQFYNSFCGGEL